MLDVQFREEIIEENHWFLQTTEFQICSGKKKKSQKDETLLPTGGKRHKIPPLNLDTPILTMNTSSGRPQQNISRTGRL